MSTDLDGNNALGVEGATYDYTDIITDLETFDCLPPVVRETMRNALFNYSATAALKCLKDGLTPHGVANLIRTMDATLEANQ